MEVAAESIRTCVGCGASDEPERLERFVWEPTLGLLHDLRRKAPGRGAHVHADPKCLAAAAKSGFRRSFRAPVEAVDPPTFIAEVRAAIRQRLDETIRVAVRSQAAGVGAKAADEQMKADTAKVVFIATDAGDASKKKYLTNAGRKKLPVVDALDGATIGAWSGRDFVAVMTIAGRMALAALRDVQNLERLGWVEG